MLYPLGGGPHPDRVKGEVAFKAARAAAEEKARRGTTEVASSISKFTIAVNWEDSWVARYGCQLDEAKYKKKVDFAYCGGYQPGFVKDTQLPGVI